MAAAQSPHLSQIPQAVRIAASVDRGADQQLKQQAIDYLTKVKDLCEETWQDCLALYVQGEGAPGPSQVGKDGKEKLETELRMYCEQVVQTVLIAKPQAMSPDAAQATYKALVEFVRTEWIEGPGEGGLSYLRNKLAATLAYLFINTYPSTIPTFLHPFLSLLSPDPSSSKVNLQPSLLTVHLLTEIAMEIHDSTMRSARPWSKDRQERDGVIRDVIRTSGDERLAVEGMISLAKKGLDAVERGDPQASKWLEATDQTLKTLAMWTPWVDLTVALTPESLAFFHRLLRGSVPSLRILSASIIRTFIAKGVKEPADRLQVLRVLDILPMLDPLEAQTRDTNDDEVNTFRVALAGTLALYGGELITFSENAEYPESLRNEAETMMNAALPLLLRFMSDAHADVTFAASPFVGDLLRAYKKYHTPKVSAPPPRSKMPPPPPPVIPLSEERRQFLSSLLDILIRQLAWPRDAEWEAPTGEEPDLGDELATMQAKRIACRSFIESISQLDRNLHTEVVARIVVSTLEALQSGGPSAVSWQQAELALHLVYTFGEMTKNNTRTAFYDLPPELASKSGRDRQRRISINKQHIDSAMSSGRTTPENGMSEDSLAQQLPGVYYGGAKEVIDYEQFPLTPLGQLLNLCMTSGIASYPHPSVTLQYFEIGVRYVDFWKCKPGSVKPMFEAMLDSRGVHHPDEAVRRRCFYLFARFVRECKAELDLDMVPPILDSLRDVMAIEAKLPEPDTPDDDVLLKATTGKSYFQDQLHLFEAAGNLVYLTKSDASRQVALLEAVAGPLMNGMALGVNQYRSNPQELSTVLQVHHHLLALGNFAKGFPQVSDSQIETLPYQPPFKQMTEALLRALDVLKTQRVVRDSARFAFSQFVNAIGTTVAELVPQFVGHVVTEFEPAELVDFLLFLGLLMHRLKKNTFETIDMLLLPLLSRIFLVLSGPITGTDDVQIHRRLKEAYLNFFTSLMNANLDGVFITDRNKPEFENVLTALLNMAQDSSDTASQRLAFSFFAKSVIAWGTSPKAATDPSVFAESAMSTHSKAVANGSGSASNQHAVPKEDRAAQALPGYENFIYQRLVPACFEVPANVNFSVNRSQLVLFEIAMLLRNTLQARGQEAVDFLLNDLLPRIQCPPQVAQELIHNLRTQPSKDFRMTYAAFIKALKS